MFDAEFLDRPSSTVLLGEIRTSLGWQLRYLTGKVPTELQIPISPCKSSCAGGLDLGLAFPTTCVSVEAGVIFEDFPIQHAQRFGEKVNVADVSVARGMRSTYLIAGEDDSRLKIPNLNMATGSVRQTLRRDLAIDDNPGYQSSHHVLPWLRAALGS
ncbi:uncharacterized protein BDZ83DRAFT_730861 [Colletotrichum acutatum]|uniref:Uncharacterized protein n=1 Tax=Glomerella acutata TaxID=27357 RepID=A0AAD8XFT3_GLOAC|nr:uncharacterized protein BDZ83DRAFT_730861 [Colletotrichum acutatum]KAK1724711.1 hypothetical protein BDZ83DRAFT_730861 [Colletotrichum acutatum]